MSDSITSKAVRSQSRRADQRTELRSTEVDLSEWLVLIVAACKKADVGPEKLAVEMECDPSYPSRVLRGEKPLTLTFLHRLPDDVKDAFGALYAESRGFLVVKPVPFDVAMHSLLSGLFSVLAHREPVIKSRMARAELRPNAVVEKVG